MSDGLVVRRGVVIPFAELRFRATRSGGPGGQHVNTSATRVELTWCVRESAALTEAQRQLIETRLAKRLDASGCLRVVADTHRSQLLNREAAEDRLVKLVRGALVVRRRRVPTRPTAASRERRLAEKRRRSEQKRSRGRPAAEE